MAEIQGTPGKWGLQGERKEDEDGLVSVRTPCNSWDTSMAYDERLQVWGAQERGDEGAHTPTGHTARAPARRKLSVRGTDVQQCTSQILCVTQEAGLNLQDRGGWEAGLLLDPRPFHIRPMCDFSSGPWSHLLLTPVSGTPWVPATDSNSSRAQQKRDFRKGCHFHLPGNRSV